MKTNKYVSPITGNVNARGLYRMAESNARKEARIELGLPADKPASFPALSALYDSIHADIAPALQSMRDIDDFIASGKSLVAWVKEKTTPANLPAWARLQAPPLPVGLPMPPNKVLAPRINLPAINV